MKNNIKILIDILMYIGLIILTGYHITNNLVHEITGTTVFILFVAHNALNFKWYKTIFKGKHDLKRNIHICINLLLLISMILTIISGILMSKSIYTFINIKGTAEIARKTHLIANAWVIVLVSIHLGLHLTPIISKLGEKIKKSDFEYGAYVLISIFIIAGIYFFISEGIWKDMFGITSFKNFNYEESMVVFYLKYFILSITISIITNYIVRKNNKEKE